jgi:hypothetical protein
MRNLKLRAVFLAVVLTMVPLSAGVGQTQEAYTYQYLLTNSAANLTLGVQGISGWYVPNFSETGGVSLNFNNVTVNGIYNASYGVGSFRNQGSLAFVNIQPDLEVTPATFLGLVFSENNRATFTNYDYAVSLNFNNFRGSGIVVMNLMAGSFSNQLTTVSFSMGKNAIAPPSTTLANVIQGNPAIVSLSNKQMAAVAATANNDIQVQGKQSAVATVQGSPNVSGLCAITMSAGINNQIIHRVEVNVNTGN